MVTIDQVCWGEVNKDGGLDLRCENGECREYEQTLRRILYQWENFPVDMVVEDFIKVPMAVGNTGFGISTIEELRAIEGNNDVYSHKFVNQFESVDDVMEKVKMPLVTHDKDETKRRMELASWLFDGIMPVRESGVDPYLNIWDPIATWMSVEGALYGLVDNPDMMHALAKRMSEGYMIMLNQMEELGVLAHSQALIHCTGAFTDELPAPGFNCQKPRLKDIWMSSTAQMFATVSPAMFEEYEINYMLPIFERFGLVYYGCCDPLDGKMNEVRKIPHLRKVSMSPWANKERGAKEIRGDYVFSNKPNPAFVATDKFNGDIVKEDLIYVKNLCKQYGCPLEFILKDISTVHHEPERLNEWAKIAREVAEGRS
jgi:hypothetical protein